MKIINKRFGSYTIGEIIIVLIEGMVIGLLAYVAIRAFDETSRGVAHCKSLGGYYAGGDCYINGEITNGGEFQEENV